MRDKVFKSLKELGYSEHSIKSILIGRRKPKYEKIILLKEKYDIPVEIWKDIKTFLKQN